MISLPGFSAPAAGFDQPLAMLHACHDRVRRSLSLLQRIAQRCAEGRVDTHVRDAARDVLRYFDIAAPLHHEDEELHVFPLVLAHAPDAMTRNAVQRLSEQHELMRLEWRDLRVPLAALAGGDDAAFDAAARSGAERYVSLYEEHAATEETLVFPAAAVLLDAPALARIGQDMARRRGAPPPLKVIDQ